MHIDNGNNKQEKRRKHYIIPMLYFFAEVILAWLIISIVQVDFDIEHWNILEKIVLGVVAIYSASKTFRIYKRQKKYKRD